MTIHLYQCRIWRGWFNNLRCILGSICRVKRIDLEISKTGHDVEIRFRAYTQGIYRKVFPDFAISGHAAEDFPETISGGQIKGQPKVIWG